MKELTPHRGRKFLDVVEGARRVFLRDGFQGASVDDIARESGVSKATLYSYFPDKRLMFVEVFRAELQVASLRADCGIDRGGSVRDQLLALARTIAVHATGGPGVRMFRISVGEAERFPMLAREYFDLAPRAASLLIARIVAEGLARGELAADDPDLAAAQFLELCTADIHARAVFMGPEAVDDAMRERAAAAAVRVFLAAYAIPRMAARAPSAT